MSQTNNNTSGPWKNLDDLFRDGIAGQEITPSSRVWKTVNRNLLLKELGHFNFTNISKLALVSASGGLVIVAVLTYLAVTLNKPAIVSPKTITQEEPALSQDSRQASEKPEPDKLISGSRSAQAQNISGPGRPVTVVPRPRASKSLMLASNTKPVPPAGQAVVLRSPAEPGAVIDNTSISAAPVTALTSAGFTGFEIQPKEDTLTINRNGEVFKYVREKTPVTSVFSAGLGVAPELAMYSTGGTHSSEWNYWLNAGFAYTYSKFTFRTGLGIGQTYDEGRYIAEYRSNDSVSFYKKVIGYYEDPKNPGQIIYITRNQVIYDSVDHIADDRTRNRYTYLQIPLLVGYSLVETPRFRLGLELGPAVSFLLSSKEAQPVVDYPNGRLIRLQDYTPSRLSVNWQVWIDLSLEYQLTRNLGLRITPYYKYYLTSPTENTENGKRNAQALGIDIGIQYLFGRKPGKK